MTNPNQSAVDFLDTCRARVDVELERCLDRPAASTRLLDAMRLRPMDVRR